MKTNLMRQSKSILCGLGALAILGSSGCTTTESQSDYSGRTSQSTTVTRQDYVYYPAYNAYYDRGSDNFRVYEGNQWVTLTTPRNASRQVVLSSESVPIAEYGTPERHYAEYVQPNMTSGSQSLRRGATTSTQTVRY